MVEEWPTNLKCKHNREYYKSIKITFSQNIKGHGENLKKEKNTKM